MAGTGGYGGAWNQNDARTGQREQWKAGFCDCFDDCNSCLLSFCCPCVQYGYNAEKIDGSSFCSACWLYCCCYGMNFTSIFTCFPVAGCQCLVAGAKRTTLRHNYMLQESCCSDCCVHWCCIGCALSQETRELAIRGPPPPRQNMGGNTPNIIINAGNTNSPPPGMVMMSPMGMQPQYAYGPNGQLIPVQSPMMMSPQGMQMMSPQYSGGPGTPVKDVYGQPMQTAVGADVPPPSFSQQQTSYQSPTNYGAEGTPNDTNVYRAA